MLDIDCRGCLFRISMYCFVL